jgi:hypothetical protein
MLIPRNIKGSLLLEVDSAVNIHLTLDFYCDLNFLFIVELNCNGMGIDDIDILLVQVKFRSKLGGARCSSPGLRPAPRSSEPCLRGTSQGNCRYIPSDIVLPYNHRLHRSATFIH